MIQTRLWRWISGFLLGMLVGPGVQMQSLKLLQPCYHQVAGPGWDAVDTVKSRMKGGEKRMNEWNWVLNNSTKLLDQPNLCLYFPTMWVRKSLSKAVWVLILFPDAKYDIRSGVMEVINLYMCNWLDREGKGKGSENPSILNWRLCSLIMKQLVILQPINVMIIEFIVWARVYLQMK